MTDQQPEKIIAQNYAALLAASPPCPFAQTFAQMWKRAGIDSGLAREMGETIQTALFDGVKRRSRGEAIAQCRAAVRKLGNKSRKRDLSADERYFVEFFSDVAQGLARPDWQFQRRLETITAGYLRGVAQTLRERKMRLDPDLIVELAFWALSGNGEPVSKTDVGTAFRNMVRYVPIESYLAPAN